MIKEQAECVHTHTWTCMGPAGDLLDAACMDIEEMMESSEYVNQFGNPACGSLAIMVLSATLQNNLIEKRSLCR